MDQDSDSTQSPSQSYSYGQLEVGQSCEIRRALRGADIDAFAAASGDHNPLHLDSEFAKSMGFRDRIAHGMLLASWVSATLAQHLPGRGTIYLRQSLEFRHAAFPDDELCIRVTVVEKKRRGRIHLDCSVCHVDGRELLRGSAEVIAPGGAGG